MGGKRKHEVEADKQERAAKRARKALDALSPHRINHTTDYSTITWNRYPDFARNMDKVNPGRVLNGPKISECWTEDLCNMWLNQDWPNDEKHKINANDKLSHLMHATLWNETAQAKAFPNEHDQAIIDYWATKKVDHGVPRLDTSNGNSYYNFASFLVDQGIKQKWDTEFVTSAASSQFIRRVVYQPNMIDTIAAAIMEEDEVEEKMEKGYEEILPRINSFDFKEDDESEEGGRDFRNFRNESWNSEDDCCEDDDAMSLQGLASEDEEEEDLQPLYERNIERRLHTSESFLQYGDLPGIARDDIMRFHLGTVSSYLQSSQSIITSTAPMPTAEDSSEFTNAFVQDMFMRKGWEKHDNDDDEDDDSEEEEEKKEKEGDEDVDMDMGMSMGCLRLG